MKGSNEKIFLMKMQELTGLKEGRLRGDSIKSANLKRHQKALKRARHTKLFSIFSMECKTKNEILNWRHEEVPDREIQEQLKTGTQEAVGLL